LEVLSAYHDRTIHGEEYERLQDHLADCPGCTKLLLDFSQFDSAAAPPGIRELSDKEVEAAWGRMQERVESDLPAAAVVAQAAPVAHLPPLRAEAPPYRSYRVSYLLAAASLAAAVGASIWGAWLHQELLQTRKPEVNVETRSLDAQPAQTEQRLERGVQRGGERGSSIQQIEELSGNRSHILELHFVSHKPFSRFRFEILRADGSEPLLSDDGPNVKPDLEGGSSMTLRLPRKSLPPGPYTFRVSGLDGGAAEPVASYSVRITP
jgi:hypothetical protein